MERAAPREVIDVDAATENTMVVFEAIESLRKDTEEGWNKLTVPLDRVIEANNASTAGMKKRDVQLACRNSCSPENIILIVNKHVNFVKCRS